MKKLICALALAVCASFAGAQVVEKGRTFADLTATHPCSAALDNRIARVTDCDAADDIGDGDGAFQCWALCDGSAPWAAVAIGAGGAGGLPGADEVTEAMLKAVNGATDEYLLTYESTVGDFEWVQHAPTASALAANGANCSAGSYPLGVDASGAAESCTAAIGGSTGATNLAIQIANGTGGSTIQASAATCTVAGTCTIPAAQELVSRSIDSGAAANLLLQYNNSTVLTVSSYLLTLGGDLDVAGNKLKNAALVVEANTAGVGSPNLLAVSSDGLKLLTNEGSTAKNYHTLPAAVGSYAFFATLCVQDADGLRLTAGTGDTIRVIDKVTATAGYVESTTIGSCISVQDINATEWFTTSITGTWTDGTFTYDDTGLTSP